MKYLQLLLAIVLAGSAFAQSFDIAVPASGAALTLGQSFTVEVDQPASQGPFQSVSVVIGLQGCGNTTCVDDGDNILGSILFEGDYKPQRHENFKPPYQNFTLSLAEGVQPGNAVIHVVQLSLFGAGPTAQLTTKNVSVTLAPATGVSVAPAQPTPFPISAKFRRR